MAIVCFNLSPTFELVYSVRTLSDEVCDATRFAVTSGGKGMNVAARISTSDPYASLKIVQPRLGSNFADAYAELAKQRCPTASFEIIEPQVEVRFSTVIVDEADPLQTHVFRTVAKATATEEHRAGLHRALGEMNSEDVVIISGSPGLFGSSAYIEIIERAHSIGAISLLDVSGMALAETLELAKPEILKINRVEAASFVGETLRPKQALTARLAQFCRRACIVTDGPNAIEYAANDTVPHYRPVPSPRIPVSPTGAGDAFMAGLAHSFSVDPNICLEAAIDTGTRWAGDSLDQLNS